LGQSFFLTVGYIDLHRDITRSRFRNNDVFDSRVKDTLYEVSSIKVPIYINNLDEVRFEFSEYYCSVSRLDQGINIVLEKLKALELSDNPLVVFLSDNTPLSLNSKTTLYDLGVCLLFIIQHLTATTKGIESPNIVSYVDIFLTFLE
jgi:N-sulfoglucosamine sulfohydrolase